jgi:hypothetical protein
MKRKLRLHLLGIVILVFCVSCGQSVKETVKPVTPGAASDQFKRVVIVPFADHTPASSLQDHCRRNVLVLEALQDALYQAGFISAAEEDVVEYLMDQGVIQAPRRSASYRTAAIERELQGGWSDEMKEELEEVIYQDISSSRSDGNQKQKPIALNTQILKEMSNAFGADYVVRGRIIEFSADQRDSFNPLRTGIVPFVFKSGQRTIFGVAESEGYENIDMDAIEDYDRMRAMLWGAGGFLTGLIGEKQGRVRGATVQIRVLVQDAGTGEVIWLNRAEACATPSSAFAEQAPDLLIAKAIDKAVNSLVGDFVSAFNSGRVARTAKKVAAPEPETESKVEVLMGEAAAEKAEKSALEARESAQQAEDAAAKAKAAAQEAGGAKVFAQQAEESAAEAKSAVKRASEATNKSEKIFEKIIAK